jgi:rhamnosyl/mannosyltransferase
MFQHRFVRVLHVYKTYFPDPPGGVQEAIRQICHATARLGVKNTVFCLSPQPNPPALIEDGISVRRAKAWAAPASCDLGGIGALRSFAEAVRNHDIVHYHFPWPFADVMHLAVNVTAKSVMTYHSDVVRQSGLNLLYAPLMWRMLRRMDRIIATSPAYAATSRILTDQRVAAKVNVIPFGLADRFPEYSAIAAEPSEPPYFLFIGVLRYYKGLSTLLKAARHVNARIVIAGAGPQEEELKRRAQELECDNIEFAGFVSEEEKFRLLRNCRAFVLPSDKRSEAFGVALLEAAMFGRPMVSVEIGTGTSFINAHGMTGLVVPPDDSAVLAKALNQLLYDERLCREFGENARSRYLSHFSSASLAAAYTSLYGELLPARI